MQEARVTAAGVAAKPGVSAHVEAPLEVLTMSNPLLCRLSVLCDGLLPIAGAVFALFAVGAVALAL